MKKIVLFITTLMMLLTVSTFADVAQKEITTKEDKSYYNDFVRFLELSGSKENQKVVLTNMFNQFKSMPNVKAEAFNDMEKMMNEELDSLNKSLFPIYKKYLSHSDLKEIIKFYESPTGKRLVGSQPQIIQESYVLGAKWGQSVAQRIMAKSKALKK